MNNKLQDSIMKQIYAEEEIEKLAQQMRLCYDWGLNNLSEKLAHERIKEWELKMKEKYK